MAHSRNPARDSLKLPGAAPEGFQYWVGTAGIGSLGSGDIECLTQ
jgi:hypothetical protein